MTAHIKNGIVLLFLFFTTSAFAQNSTSDAIIVDGIERSYRIYVPAVYDGSTEVPLILNFHGYGSANWQQEIYADFRPIADTANFIIVHPQGTPVNGAMGWNNFGPVSFAAADVTFINNLLDTLSQFYKIDQNRIYSTGMSNGGFMSYDLACMLSSRIAAVASVTGSMVSLHVNSCQPQRPVPVMQIHGTADPIVTYSGTGGIINSLHVDSLIQQWLNINEITAPPVVTQLPDINTSDNSTVVHYLFSGGINGNTVEFYKIIGGGHTWPGSLINTSSGATNQDINASKEIWRFFRQYTLNGISTGVEKSIIEDEQPFLIYPDPAGKGIVLKKLTEAKANVNIYNTSGALIYSNSLADSFHRINLNEPAGIYLYQIEIDDKRYAGKVAKY